MIYLTLDINDIGTRMIEIPIFLYDKNAKQRDVEFFAGHEITEEKFEVAQKNQGKGGLYQILYEHLDDAINDFGIEKEYFIQKNEDIFYMLDLKKEREEKFQEDLNEEFLFKEVFNQSFDSQNFSSLIKRMKSEIALFSLSHSKEQTQLINTLLLLFNRDTQLNREVAIAYFMAKTLKVTDELSLLSLCMACYIKDLGLTQLKYQNEFEAFMDDENANKVSAYSLFVFAKTAIETNALVKRIVIEYFELFDGSGMPRGKKEDQIELLSQICAATSYLFKLKGDMDVNGKKLAKGYSINDKTYILHPEVLATLDYLFKVQDS